jgi:hypothetical protein
MGLFPTGNRNIQYRHGSNNKKLISASAEIFFTQMVQAAFL